MRLLVISQYFWPEEFRVNELTSELGRRGHTVTVLTGRPNYPEGRVFPEYAADPERYGSFGGARVLRVPMVTRGNSRLQMTLSFLSFALAASVVGAFRLRSERFDVVFAFQPSPVTVGLPAVTLGRIKRAPVVLWVLDQWPETLVAIGAVRSPLAIRAIGRLVSFIYRRCDLVLTPSKSLVPLVRRYCSDRAEVGYFPNWVESPYHDDAVEPAPEVDRGSAGSFSVMFAGNIGEAQDFPAILDAAELLRNRPNIRWLIVGDGRMRGWVEGEIVRRGLEGRFVLLGRYPAERMASFFHHADALLVSLKREPVFSATVPGKLQSYLAAGKPIVGMLDGEGADTICDAGAGFACAAGDAASLAGNLLKMSELSPAERQAMGARGRGYSRREFDRDTLIARLDAWLTAIGGVDHESSAFGGSPPPSMLR